MCNANDINGCEKPGTIELKSKNGRSEGYFCSHKCANEYAGEISEGTWCPFPKAKGALTPKQIKANLEEYDYRYSD